MSRHISRAKFLKLAGGAVIVAASGTFLWEWHQRPSRIPCRLLGPSRALGHKIRDGEVTGTAGGAPAIESKIVIIGGGIAGLSAAWWLLKQGVTDFVVLELEKEVGGNSSYGSNTVSAYPWGAHYIPLANEESKYVRDIFQELGIIERFEADGMPVYNELYLCHDPQERLWKDGTFQEGLVPKRGLRDKDENEMSEFFQIVHTLRNERGSDGQPAFAIPIALSSQDEKYLKLDTISMAQWLRENSFRSRPLLWYVDYCCKDDYGVTAENVSAWAGLHYFAGRRGHAANAETNSVVTWPEGNGFIVKQLKEKLKDYIRTETAVYHVTQKDGSILTSFANVEGGARSYAKSDYAIFAAPRFVAGHIIEALPDANRVGRDDLVYAPWMVANVTLKSLPPSRGVSSAWDNVNYYSHSLGYVVATHQNITTRQGATVITHYFPLADRPPREARKKLEIATADEWLRHVVSDLEKMHPHIAEQIESIDLWPWGHGMISPKVGYIWGDTRRRLQESSGNIFFAHSDMSGISNFEEAQYQGVEAANKILERVKQG